MRRPASRGLRLVPLREVGDQLGEVDLLARQCIAGAHLFEVEQRVGQGDEALDLVLEGLQGLLGLFRWPGSQELHLELGAHQRERGAELVGGVGEELSLALVRRTDPREQGVQGVSQAGDLVVPVRVDRQHRSVARPLGGNPVSLHGSERCAGHAVADQGRRDQGGQVRDHQLEEKLTQGLVVLVSGDRRRHDHLAPSGPHRGGDDAVGVVRRREHAADVLTGDGAGSGLRDGRDVHQPRRRVAADDAAAAVVDLVALTRSVGRWGVARGQVAGDHRVVGVQVLVELAVQGELDAPEHERAGHEQDHRHGGRNGHDEPGDDGPVTEQATPEAHRCCCSRR